MPRTKKTLKRLKDSSGRFIPKQSNLLHASLDHRAHLESPLYSVWKPGANSDSDCEDLNTCDADASSSDSDAESGGEDSESSQAWLELRNERRAAADALRLRRHRATSMRSAERVLDGPIDRKGGAKDKTGKKRGPYLIGGDSLRTVQRKRQKIMNVAASEGRLPTDPHVQRQLESLRQCQRQPENLQQQTLTGFFLCRNHPSPVGAARPEQQGTMRSEGSVESESDSESLLMLSESEDEVPLTQTRPKPNVTSELGGLASSTGHTEPDGPASLIEDAERVAEYTEDVLESSAPKTPKQLYALADDGRCKARKAQDYRSEVLFASLMDFYKWHPRQGRLRAALRIARNHQRGPAFARVLCTQARHFEATERLKPSRQGQKTSGESMLDDEAVALGVQAWLRTLNPGERVGFLGFSEAASDTPQYNSAPIPLHQSKSTFGTYVRNAAGYLHIFAPVADILPGPANNCPAPP
ncbi:hypothetical protein ONZ51_g1255 [Trametes cubensis]|uniref:Uncharacterized protein n=1 Tax=Trametes cubensis TaxID=1111947 RepID=A0AAD7U1X5_9APHY|nr:hypothetical protein ONZ51_g1255 [Trametes cubensis]